VKERTPPRRDLSSRWGGVIATVSTVAVFAAIAFGVTSASGWPAIRKAFLSRKYFVDSFPEIWKGFQLNIKIFLIAFALCLILGLIVAVVRLIPGPIAFPFRLLAVVYTDVFRAVPSIVLIYLFGFGVPQGLGLDKPWNNPLIWGTVAIVLNSGAYVAEVFRSGIRSVHPSQMAAARSLGLSRFQSLRYVIVPQAFRRVIPPLVNDFIAVVQSTALLSTLGPLDGLRRAQNYGSKKFNFTPYLGATLLFLLVTIPLARLADYLLSRQEANQR
jgi:polar amino acid transport system permease protein